jgi:hypothetical protein
MPDTTPRVLLSHTGDFGDRPGRGNSYIEAAFRALDRADVVVTDMSLLPATQSSPKQVSESLAEDTDLYIGIIGWRYGSPVRESPEVSYTQLEFRTAAETGVPRLVFLLGERFKSKDAGEPNFDRQLAFRDEITDSGITVQWFDSPEELETKLFQSIAKPPGWDPAFLRMFLSAVDDAAAPAPMVGLQAAPEVLLSARRIGSSKEREGDLDPVACALEADRLVVLGGPGTGKSWLARQVARRAAKRGFAQLADREPLKKIELPLMVAISSFFALTEQTPSVWGALVTEAVKELEPFLPNHRCMSRIRRVLEPRNDHYFVILEGLDEAAQLRSTTAKRVFDALIQGNCRLMLTSRPGSWRGQLNMMPPEGKRKALRLETIELQPLEPSQVKRLVRGSLQEEKDANALLDFLGRHPLLAEAARVPLMAQLIALVGPADRSLRRSQTITLHDIYDLAINRILRGEWRGTESSETLRPYRVARTFVREWAWRSAVQQNDPVSGLADWADALEVDFAESDPAIRSAVDNVFPVVERDLDRLIERRRFLHHTIRERLVAEHIASLSLEEAASELEPHLWYDDTWHSIVPAAVAAHRQPTGLLRRILVGDAADPEKGMAAFHARDGLGELGEMLIRLHAEASDSIWNNDRVLQPIFENCFRERGVSVTPQYRAPEYREQALNPEQVACGLRTGEPPAPDQIRSAAFSATERSDLAEAVRRRLVCERAISARGTLLSRRHLAMALEALQPEQAALAGTRLQLINMLADDGRKHQADQVFAAILTLQPTDAERQTVVPLAIAAMNNNVHAWSLVSLAKSLMAVELTPEQRGEVRDALLAGIDREPTATWKCELVRVFGVTEPAANDIAACVSHTLASKGYRDLESRDQEPVRKTLSDLTAAYADQAELLLELIQVLRTGSVDWDRCNLVEQIAGRSTREALRPVAQELVDAILNDRAWIYDGLKLLRLLKAPIRLQQTVVERLLELLQEPDAPWGTIGEEIAKLEATDPQRAAAAEHLLSRLTKNEFDNRVKLHMAGILALLCSHENQRLKALSILRKQVFPSLAGSDLSEMIKVLAALEPGETLDPADLRMIVEQFEAHRFDQSLLPFGWAEKLINLGRPNPEIRKRLIAATLIPAVRLGEVGFISFNDRLIDAGILAGDHEELKRIVGEAYIEVLRKGVDGSRRGAPLLESTDTQVILERFSKSGVPSDQQEACARLAGTLLPSLNLQDPLEWLRASRIFRYWRALNPPEDLVCQLDDVLIQAIRDPGLATNVRTYLLVAVLELEPSPRRSQVADIIVDQILAPHERIDPSYMSDMIGRVTITADHLRCLVRAGSVPTPILRVAAASTRRSLPLSAWESVLPDLVRRATTIG